MTPTIGRIVQYRLSFHDCSAISQLREQLPRRRHNDVYEGQVLPAVVVAVNSPTSINLQVLLDGDCSYWATSRMQGDAAGCWAWPERV